MGEYGSRRIPAGLWRRSFALLVDLFIAAILFQGLMVAAYEISNGRIQFNPGRSDCGGLQGTMIEEQKPSWVILEPGYHVKSVHNCEWTTYLGRIVGRTEGIAQQSRLSETEMRTIKVMKHIDKDGQPFSGFLIGDLTLPLFFLIRLIGDATGGSIGRRLAAIKAIEDGASVLSWRKAAWRTFLFALPLLPGIYLGLFLATFPLDFSIAPTGYVLFLFEVFIYGIAATAICERRKPFYDQWSGSGVIVKCRYYGTIFDKFFRKSLRT